MTFNPSAGQWDNVPANPNRPTNITYHPDHPTAGYDTTWTGKTIGYARGVMSLLAGHPMPVHANPGPWAYTWDVASAIDDLRQYLGYSAGTQLDAITLTLDSHHRHDIAHPPYWRQGDGTAVAPFTAITAAQVANLQATQVSALTTTQLNGINLSAFAEQMVQAATASGVPAGLADRLVRQTFLGAARMLAETISRRRNGSPGAAISEQICLTSHEER